MIIGSIRCLQILSFSALFFFYSLLVSDCLTPDKSWNCEFLNEFLLNSISPNIKSVFIPSNSIPSKLDWEVNPHVNYLVNSGVKLLQNLNNLGLKRNGFNWIQKPNVPPNIRFFFSRRFVWMVCHLKLVLKGVVCLCPKIAFFVVLILKMPIISFFIALFQMMWLFQNYEGNNIVIMGAKSLHQNETIFSAEAQGMR